MLTFLLLICVAFVAKVELIFAPELLKQQKLFLVNYKFRNPNGWFCRFCRSIPSECPAQKIGLPPMCKLNPLFDEIILLQMKANDVAHQDELISMASYL
ncbi:MAG: Mo-dependent nitrogenase C-terminal domain-containing protein [Candidatus Obscuribacter sp.]|nr:Mo-dependent nitrogenase C-terminal domain-containing protein [Candidatus Obscuribacter sp.]